MTSFERNAYVFVSVTGEKGNEMKSLQPLSMKDNSLLLKEGSDTNSAVCTGGHK